MNNPIFANKSTPKDFFLQLMEIIVLYVGFYSLVALLFEYINILIPDALDNTSYVDADTIRWSIAKLMLLFPVYLYTAVLLFRELVQHPEKHELRVRKWLLYATLFLAACIIISDLIWLLYCFMIGDLTWRFIIKVITVLVLFTGLFLYYQRHLRKQWRAGQLKTTAWLISGIMLVIIGAGFFTVGSPFIARLERFDERRVQDLIVIQEKIVNYWQHKNKLPAGLANLTDNVAGFTVPVDPQTKAAYHYEIVNQLSFKLCANFNLPAPTKYHKSMPLYPYFPQANDNNWQHGKGWVCFKRTIDPAFYTKRT